MDFKIFEQIGAVPGIISDFKKELIGMQFQYALEKACTLRNFKRNGIGAKGTIEQYNELINKLTTTSITNRKLYEVLSKEEIELLCPDKYLEEDYSLWYNDSSYERLE